MRKNQTNGFGTNVNNLTTAKFASITAKKKGKHSFYRKYSGKLRNYKKNNIQTVILR